MQINRVKFERVVAEAKVKAAGNARWNRAIDRAAQAVLAGELIVTVLAHGALVTSANGTYHANGACQCAAAKAGHKECYHRAAARLMEIYETAPEPKAPRITRSVERDARTGVRCVVVRCDGWMI